MKICGVEHPTDVVTELSIPGSGEVDRDGQKKLGDMLLLRQECGFDLPALIPLEKYRELQIGRGRSEVVDCVGFFRLSPYSFGKVGECEYQLINPIFNWFNEGGTEGPWSWKWITKQGTLPKRVAKVIRKELGVNLPPNIMGGMGEVLRSHCPENHIVHYDVTQDFDWEDGDFGDEGSCYWGCRTVARDMIREVGGFAIRLYEGSYGGGSARCWGVRVPEEDNVVALFNSYGSSRAGKLDSKKIVNFARILAFVLGQSYQITPDLCNYGSSDNDLWINGGSGVLVGPPATLEKFEGEMVDLRVPQPRTRFYLGQGEWCDCCEDTRSTEYYASIDRYLCDHCRAYHYNDCHHCGTLVNDDDTYAVGGEWWCCDCYHRHSFSCGSCGERYHIDNLVNVGGSDWCSTCARDYAVECPRCGSLDPRTYAEDYYENVPGFDTLVCPDCAERLKVSSPGHHAPCDSC